MCDIRDVIRWINGRAVRVNLGTAWWWLLEAETYVGAIDSVYENTVHMLVLILWRILSSVNIQETRYVHGHKLELFKNKIMLKILMEDGEEGALKSKCRSTSHLVLTKKTKDIKLLTIELVKLHVTHGKRNFITEFIIICHRLVCSPNTISPYPYRLFLYPA
jgi:hypothetical protein